MNKRITLENEIPITKLDEVDRSILAHLHQDSRISYTDLAKKVGLSRVAVQARVSSLVASNVIERFTVVINPEAIGINVSSFFNVSVEPSKLNDVAERLANEPAITSLYHMTGPSTLHMHGVFESMAELESFLLEKVYTMPGVIRVESELLLKRYKSRMGMRL